MTHGTATETAAAGTTAETTTAGTAAETTVTGTTATETTTTEATMTMKTTDASTGTGVTPTTQREIDRVEAHAAHNYHPLPVVVEHAEGAWVTDVDGRRYLDCLAAYSAVNFGHGNRRLVDAAHAQLDRVTLTSRAFHSAALGPFVEALARLAKKDMVLPMNTGAEAVESAIKVARRWAYDVKGA